MRRSQPMGPGGMSVGIISGRPVPVQTQKQREDDAKQKLEAAQQKASLLVKELTSSPTLAKIDQALQALIMGFLKEDSRCQSLVDLLYSLRHDIEVAPALAEKIVHQLMGPRLVSMMKEAQAAP